MPYLTKTKTITIAVITTVSMLIPTSAYSLGIGNIKLQSKLNENLKAEVELLDAANEDPSGLHVNLAPLGKFVESNVPWNHFLRNMKIKPIKKSNGAIVIELTSREVLKEVFLNFILEVSSRKGVLYREFTILLDPPTDYAPSFISAIPKTNPVVDNNFQFLTTSVNKTSNKENSTQYDSNQYGPIKPSDYIRKIAKRTRYDDVSIEQMIMALFKANPQAFFTDNINALVVKKMLNIPEKEKVLEISRKEALDQVDLQNNAWKERITAKVRIPQTGLGIAKDNTQIPQEDSGTQTTKSASALASNNGERTHEKPSVSISSTEISAIFAKLNQLEQKMELMQNNLVSKDRLTIQAPPSTNEPNQFSASAEGLALLAKQDELEKKVESMQKMLASKDELIAKLQEQNKAITTLPVQPIATTKEPKKVSKTATEVIAKIKPHSIMQTLEENFMLLLKIGALIGVLLGALSYFLWLKKKRQEQAEIDFLNEYLKPLDLAKSSFKKLDVSVNDFLTDDHLYSTDIEHKETDICTIVDVYLSYADYKNAEALISQAVENYPKIDEYKLELLKVYLASKNKTAFDSYKTKLESIVDQNDQEFWAKVAKMEDALIAESPVYVNHNEQVTLDAEQKPVENTDANITDNKLNTATTDSKINFDKYDFNDIEDIEIKSIEGGSITSTDNEPTTVDNEIDVDNHNFEVTPMTEASIESVDHIQTTADNELNFDMYEFEDIEINPTTGIGIKADDNTKTTDDEITFDMYDFDDIEVSRIAEESITSTDNTTDDDEVTFDLYDFDEIKTR